MPNVAECDLNGDRGAYGPSTCALPQRRDEHGDLCLDCTAMVDVARTTDVTFLKLTPLKGG